MLPMIADAQIKNSLSTSTITGTITYKVSDYVGNKVDVGAIVTLIPKSSVDSIAPDIVKCEKRVYDGIYSVSAYSYLYNILHDGALAEKLAKEGSKYREYLTASETSRAAIDLFNKLYDIEVSKTERYEALIDANGSYTLKIPSGEYYIIFKSNNKTFKQLLFKDGIVNIEEVELLPNRIKRLSHNFEIELFE